MSKSCARECDESCQSLVVDAENAGFWRGLTRVWTRANSLFYFNPHFHSVRFWIILKKWRATPFCSGAWEKLRIFLGRAARQTSCIVLLRKNCKSVITTPASLLQSLSTYILCQWLHWRSFLLKNVPFLLLCSKRYHCLFFYGSIFKLCSKRSGALYQPWQEIRDQFCLYLKGEPCSLWASMFDSQGNNQNKDILCGKACRIRIWFIVICYY